MAAKTISTTSPSQGCTLRFAAFFAGETLTPAVTRFRLGFPRHQEVWITLTPR